MSNENELDNPKVELDELHELKAEREELYSGIRAALKNDDSVTLISLLHTTANNFRRALCLTFDPLPLPIAFLALHVVEEYKRYIIEAVPDAEKKEVILSKSYERVGVAVLVPLKQ